MHPKTIRVLRALHGVTQRELAHAANVSVATLSLIESGQLVSTDARMRILAGLNYKPEMAPHIQALAQLAGEAHE